MYRTKNACFALVVLYSLFLLYTERGILSRLLYFGHTHLYAGTKAVHSRVQHIYVCISWKYVHRHSFFSDVFVFFFFLFNFFSSVLCIRSVLEGLGALFSKRKRSTIFVCAEFWEFIFRIALSAVRCYCCCCRFLYICIFARHHHPSSS